MEGVNCNRILFSTANATVSYDILTMGVRNFIVTLQTQYILCGWCISLINGKSI